MTEAVVDDGFVDSGRICECRPCVSCAVECQVFLDAHQIACPAQTDAYLEIQDTRANLLVQAQRPFLLRISPFFEERQNPRVYLHVHLCFVITPAGSLCPVVDEDAVLRSRAGVQVRGVHSHEGERQQEEIRRHDVHLPRQLVSPVDERLNGLAAHVPVRRLACPGWVVIGERVSYLDFAGLFVVVHEPRLSMDMPDAFRICSCSPRAFAILRDQPGFEVPHERGSDLRDVHRLSPCELGECDDGIPVIVPGILCCLAFDDLSSEFEELKPERAFLVVLYVSDNFVHSHHGDHERVDGGGSRPHPAHQRVEIVEHCPVLYIAGPCELAVGHRDVRGDVFAFPVCGDANPDGVGPVRLPVVGHHRLERNSTHVEECLCVSAFTNF